jgi:hydroxymethylbilane synthase
MKDMPTRLVDGLTIAAITVREDPRDVLVAKGNNILKHLPAEALVGTSSLRRQSQILHHFPGFHIVQIRGNVETRLRRIEGPDSLDAVIVAAAGLNRLGLYDRVTEYLPTDICLPAIAQGALGIEIREDNDRVRTLVEPLNDPATCIAVSAERAFLNRLGGTCQVPIAGYAEIRDTTLVLVGMVASINGAEMIRDTVVGSPEDPDELGIRLAEQLLAEGAAKILDEILARLEESPQ